MFTSKAKLLQRTPKDGVDRKNYLKLLTEEFTNAKTKDAKYQVLANLGNFAYDPINYEFMREINVPHLFLQVLSEETDELLVQYAISGTCNLCLDPLNADIIVKENGIELTIQQLYSTNEETVLNAITTLLYLTTSETKNIVATSRVVDFMRSSSNSGNRRLSNLAIIFLEDVCCEKVEKMPVTLANIPLPN